MPYSYSSIEEYKTCPMKYRLHVLDDSGKSSINFSATFWTCMHTTLEKLYKLKRERNIPSKEDLINLFLEEWNNEIKKLKENDGWLHYFDDNTLNVYVEDWKDIIGKYYDKYYPFDQAITMDIEKKFYIHIGNKALSGKIDRIDLKDDVLIIIDYKTNRSFIKDEDIKNQISLYALWILENYKEQVKKIKWRVVYLRLDNHDPEREITPEILEQVKNEYTNIIDEIEKKTIKYDWWDESAFSPKQWSHCNYCDFQMWCPIFKHYYMKDEKITAWSLWERTIKNLIEEYAKFAQAESSAKNNKKELSWILSEYAKEKWVTRLYWETKKVTIWSKISYKPREWMDSEVIKKLDDDHILDDVLSVNNDALWKKFNNDELSYDDYKEIVEKKISIFVSRSSDLKDSEKDLDVLGDEQ